MFIIVLSRDPVKAIIDLRIIYLKETKKCNQSPEGGML
jgi:hypothetical protein